MISGPVADLWLDRTSAVPLYLQLKAMIRERIFEGRLPDRAQLPGVLELASMLEVNFETVRKAYKELEQEGLLQMIRGRGTFVAESGSDLTAERRRKFSERSRLFVAEMLEQGLQPDELRALVEIAIKKEAARALIIATECNQPEVEQISEAIRQHVGVPVRGVLLPDLRAEVQDALNRRVLAGVVTTGFHINEVRERLQGTGVPVDFVTTSMSPETRRAIDAFDKAGRFAFFCRDAESIPFYQSVLAAELGVQTPVRGATVDHTDSMMMLLNEVDVALTSPTVFAQVRDAAPAGVAVFNVLDRIEPMSLLALRDRFLAARNRVPNLAGPRHGI